MNRSNLSKLTLGSRNRGGFSLIEVVLAIGIFLVTVLALVGILGPTLQSVDEVEKTDEISSVVNTVNAFLQSSPDIAPNASKFNAIYRAVESGDYATIFVFRRFADDTTTDVELAIGFLAEDSVDPLAELDPDTDFDNVAGPLYRVVLSASSVTPESSLDSTTRTNGVYSLKTSNPVPDSANPTAAFYPEGYLAMEVRIYSEDWSPGFDPGNLPPHGSSAPTFTLAELLKFEPLFTYNTAVVR